MKPRPGNFLPDDYVRALPIVTEWKPGCSYVAVLYHDDGCPKSGHDARGVCSCHPDVQLRELPREFQP